MKQFTPQKAYKGIIYYEDRTSELKINPGLASNSPTKSFIKTEVLDNNNNNNNNNNIIKNENGNENTSIMLPNKIKLEMIEGQENSTELITNKTSKRKPRKSANSATPRGADKTETPSAPERKRKSKAVIKTEDAEDFECTEEPLIAPIKRTRRSKTG